MDILNGPIGNMYTEIRHLLNQRRIAIERSYTSGRLALYVRDALMTDDYEAIRRLDYFERDSNPLGYEEALRLVMSIIHVVEGEDVTDLSRFERIQHADPSGTTVSTSDILRYFNEQVKNSSGPVDNYGRVPNACSMCGRRDCENFR